MYESLLKIYYKNPSEYEKIYSDRFHSSLTKHFNFIIQEFNHRNKYPAFFCYSEDFASLSDKIYQKHENLLQILDSVPDLLMNQFILAYLVDEVRATSNIEGVHSTRKEIKDVVTGSIHSDRFSSIVAKYKSIIHLEQINFKTCNDIRAFYDDFLHKEITAENPNHSLDGKLFRNESVDIISSTGKIIHRGLFPESKIIDSLNIALNILNDDNIPILARVSIFHYLFEYIHPFYDGNGRTARFIVSYFLANRFHILLAIRLSVIIQKNRSIYYNLFKETDSEYNRGDLTPFVLKFSDFILDTLNDILNILDSKFKQFIRYRYDVLPKLVHGDELTMKIYDALLQSTAFFGSGISMENLMLFTGKSRNTIKSRLDSIPKNHIIIINGKKFFYKLNTMIFNEVRL